MKSIFNRSTKGFTLIELLVVIAIIAILATIILASLGTARQRARNTRASSEISQMRAQAEIFSGNQIIPSYANLCTTAKSGEGIEDLKKSVENIMRPATVHCDSDTDSWAAGVQLLGTNAEYFCADSTGYAGPSTPLVTGAKKCTPPPSGTGGAGGTD